MAGQPLIHGEWFGVPAHELVVSALCGMLFGVLGYYVSRSVGGKLTEKGLA